MRIARIIVIALAAMFFVACGVVQEHKDLQLMEAAVRQRIKYNDEENKIRTNILELKAISYIKVDEREREYPDDVYLCKLYLKAKWSQLTGNRVYNINDTIYYYFNKNKVLERRLKNDD